MVETVSPEMPAEFKRRDWILFKPQLQGRYLKKVVAKARRIFEDLAHRLKW
jgi:DNA polymerase elongation subunit (family B)